MTINEKMNNAVINDNFNTIESIALNPKNAYVNVGKVNIFNGKFWREWEWVDISSVINKEDYFEDLNGDCQDMLCNWISIKIWIMIKWLKIMINPLKKRIMKV